MSRIDIGDEVVTIKPLWHHGEDIGDRLGRVVNTTSHVIVELYDYNDNPVKCFRNEVEVIHRGKYFDEIEFPDDEELNNIFGKLFSKP